MSRLSLGSEMVLGVKMFLSGVVSSYLGYPTK